jgi:hypothetical protein
MTDRTIEEQPQSDPAGSRLDIGGLTFETSFRAPNGATLRVYGDTDGTRTELLRFDDFVDGPHYHLPGAGPSVAFDRDKLGDPLNWVVGQIQTNLPALLTEAGYAAILPDVDVAAVSDGADRVKQAMEACVPDGYVRVPEIGLQRTTPSGAP